MNDKVNGYGATWLAAALVTGVYVGGCALESLDPVPRPSDGGGGAGGSGGHTASGGAGGQGDGSRGDPADFPSDCLTTCEEACDALESCGAEASSTYPMSKASCMTLCGLATSSPYSGDVSGNFRCCASQESCQAVQHCGGWLEHPDVVASCDLLCTCFGAAGNEALSDMTKGREAPPGYRFAPDQLMVSVEGASIDLGSLPGVVTVRGGRFARVQLGQGADAASLAALQRAGRVLPTFVDAGGRFSAASGKVVVIAPTVGERELASAIAAAHSLPAPRALGLGKGLHIVDGHDGWRALDLLAALQAAGLRAELDMVREYSFRYLPDDPLFPEQWHLRNVGQGESTAGVDGRVSEAWDVTLGDPQIILAINDDGVDLNHPDFAGKLEPELNYPSNWETLIGQGEFGGHGTSVAGVAGAKADDSVGGAGVCPGCRVLPHLLGTSSGGGFQVTDQEIADGFKEMVDSGAAVINNSWGYTLGDPIYVTPHQQLPPLPSVVSAAFDYAEQTGRGGKGTVIVWAAGNDNQELDDYSGYPTTVAVAAVGDLGLKSYYSSFGPEVSVAAPSNGALTGITTTRAGGGHTDAFGGTSSASPFITGVVGLILSANPTLTAAEVRDILAASASPIDPVFGDYQAGHSDYYGAGLVNAYVAVQMATGACTDPAACQPPSDACGPSCGTRTLCDSCRTQADCASGHVCQALPSLGRMLCVPEVGGGACPDGTREVNGYCLPSAETCGLCLGGEECNGRDDNCDGTVDEGACDNSEGLCFIDGPGCADGLACAAIVCIPSCTSDDDCEEGYSCEQLKDQYGASGTPRGCLLNPSGDCRDFCGVIASSADDASLAAFVDCMEDGQASCNKVQQCVGELP